jgi:hypothetical protein
MMAPRACAIDGSNGECTLDESGEFSTKQLIPRHTGMQRDLRNIVSISGSQSTDSHNVFGGLAKPEHHWNCNGLPKGRNEILTSYTLVSPVLVPPSSTDGL